MFLPAAVLLIVSCVVCADYNVPTTTKVYDLEVPGSQSIRIFEGESLWNAEQPTKFEHRSFNSNGFTTLSSQTNLNYPIETDENTEFAPVALQDFLNNYAAKYKNNKSEDNRDMESIDLITKAPDTEDENPEEKSKSWNLMHYQKHNHPYEDKKGWVTLEPVPWSVSKISKWQPNTKPNHKPWELTTDEKPWENEFANFPDNDRPAFNIKPQKPNTYFQKPNYEIQTSNNYFNRPQTSTFEHFQTYQVNKPENRPQLSKPTTSYTQKFPNFSQSSHKTPIKISGYYKETDPDCEEQDRNDIITDGLPPNFPTSIRDTVRRRGSDIHPDTHPLNGDGEWVLLSTTKGYKYPKNRQRSLEIKPQSLGVHRAVRLTVLPPLKNSKVNMTTSHGGLLQVESTFETVDQAQKKYVRRQKQKLKKKSNKRPQKQNYNKKPVLKEIVVPTVTSIPRRNTSPDTSAVLAAVGAGMIPATMAMLVPMAMNGRKKRDTSFVTSNPYSSIEITLPRNLQL